MNSKAREILASPDFDYDAFEAQAIEALKGGKPLTGKEGVVTPLIKRILEASLEGELEAHPSWSHLVTELAASSHR